MNVKVGVSMDTKNFILENSEIFLDYTKGELSKLLNLISKLADLDKITTSDQAR